MSTYSNYPLFNYINIQIVVNQAISGGKYYFPDIPQLRDAKIQAISFYGGGLTPIIADYNNVTVMNNADALRSFVTLYSGNKEAIQNLPILKLVNVTVGTGNADGLFTIDNLKVDFSKSYVNFASGYTPTTPLNFSIMFGVYYLN